jgi:LmbE family N-acetylglucosaminyl deacetylase
MAMALERFPEDWERALCIVAHPDDLEYGASAAVARWTGEGRHVVYLLATSGEAGIDGMDPETSRPAREQEERDAAAAVGVDIVEFLGYPDGALEYGLALRRDLARAIRRHRPEIVVTVHFGLTWGPGPGGGLNQADHRHLGLAVLDACRDAGNRWVFTELLAEGHEPWGGSRLCAVAGSTTPTHALPVGPAQLEAGVASLEAHRLYFEGLGEEHATFDPRTFLTEHLRAAGGEIGSELAVAFEVYSL